MHKLKRMQARILPPALLLLVAAIPICAQPQTTIQMGNITVQTQGNGAIFVGSPAVSQPAPDTSAVDPSKTASISGTVLSASTGEPLRRARITLATGNQKTPPRGALTDESGHFAVGNISPGQYDISVEHSGYVQQEYGQDKPGKAPETLTLEAGQKVDDLNFRLQQAAVITGHVYDESGDPIENANVDVLRMTYVRGKRQLEGEQSGSTNDQGEYRIFDLKPGHYYVAAAHGGNGFMSTLMDGDVVYPPVFFPNASSAEQASEIDLKPGDEIPGVDFQLTPNSAKGYEVSGKVIGAITVKAGSGAMSMVMITEKAIADAELFGFGLNTRQVMANPADGTFRFSNVTPGTYVLRAMLNENGQQKIATEDVVVGNANTTGVALVLTSGIDISGHVTLEGKAVQAEQVGVNISPASQDQIFGGSYGQVAPDGSFLLKNVMDGTYKLQIGSTCETCYLKSANSRGADLLGDSFDVRGGVGPQSIDLVYSGNTADVSGTVKGDDDKPAGGAIVIAVPVADTPNRDQRYKTSSTDQYGNFDLKGLAPGDYDVVALTNFDEDGQEYMDPAFMQPYAQKAQRLSVKENDHQTLELTAIPTGADSQ